MSLIGLFTIVIKISRSEDNVRNSGRVDREPPSFQDLFFEAAWVLSVDTHHAAMLILKYFLQPVSEWFNVLFQHKYALPRCLGVTERSAVARRVILSFLGCKIRHSVVAANFLWLLVSRRVWHFIVLCIVSMRVSLDLLCGLLSKRYKNRQSGEVMLAWERFFYFLFQGWLEIHETNVRFINNNSANILSDMFDIKVLCW